MTRQEIEHRIRLTIESEGVVLHPWMNDLGLGSTELLVFAKMFHLLKSNCLGEKLIDTQDMLKCFKVSQSQFNNIIKSLSNKGLLYRRIEGKGRASKSYYSLFENLFNSNGSIQSTQDEGLHSDEQSSSEEQIVES